MAIVGFWNSLAEVQKVTNDKFVKGVIAELIEEGGILDRMAVTQIRGTQLTYNRESTLPAGDFHAPGDEWTSSQDVTYSQQSATLKIHGDQFEMDAFTKKTYTEPNQPEAIAKQQAAKGLKRRLEDRLIYGSTSADANAFNGLHATVAAAQTQNNGSGSTGAGLSLHNLKVALDLMRGGKPSLLLMPRAIGRRIDESGWGGTTSYPVAGKMGGDIGMRVESFDGIPIVRSDYMVMTETISGGTFSAKTGGSTGSIIAVRFGAVESGGLSMGLGNELFEEESLNTLPNKNAALFRIFTFLCLVLGSTKAMARIDGILDLPVTA